MYQQRKANIGQVHAANAYGGQGNPSHSSDTSNPTVIAWAAVEAIIKRALASDTRMSAAAIAGLLVDHLVVPTQDVETTTELAIGVEL